MKTKIGIFAVLIALVVLGTVAVYALPQNEGANGQENMFAQNNGHHEEVKQIMDTGTYQDLVDYRESTGFDIMPMISSEDDFNFMQEMHEKMEAFMESKGLDKDFKGFRGHGGPKGNNGFGGCPMNH